MLLSFAWIFAVGLGLGWLCKKIRFPSLFGMLLGGILIGPYALNLMDGKVLGISSELRRVALIIILVRAGLKLDLNDLRKVGRPAVLLCFLPACFEVAGMILLAPLFLGITRLDAAILGAVVGAVSPAVIVPRMIRLIDEGRGTDKGIPQMLLAGASVDDVFVIVLFTSFTGYAQGAHVSAMSFVNIPISIVAGAIVGMGIGWLLTGWFSHIHLRDTVKVILLLTAAFLLVSFEDSFGGTIPFASLIAVMGMGLGMRRRREDLAARLAARFDKLWVPAEILLFVLVGASVVIDSALSTGPRAILLVLAVLILRMAGVFVCLMGTRLTIKERLFCMIAYTPKATVQAAIGGIPLAMGLPCGEIVLTVSVVAILLTAPLGAFGIDFSYPQLLRKETTV